MRRLAWFGSLAFVTTLAAVATIALARAGAADPPAASAEPGRPAGDPVTFVKSVVAAVVDDDYRRAWRTLHPAHQRVAPLEDYVSCEWREPIAGRLESIAVLGVADKRRALPGLGPPVASKAIQLRVTIEDAATGKRTALTSTFHAVPVEGRWRWVLPGERYGLYRMGACAQGGSPAGTA